MPGSFARNFHEGTRSEYLALYFFSALGSAVPIPHPEDTGLDLHCTIAENIGRLARPTCFYSVQIKSEFGPWVLEDKESVAWLVEQSFPIFLCIVEKKAGKIRVFQTLPRHLLHAHPPLPDRIELVPQDTSEGANTDWHKRAPQISLSAPILEVEIGSIQDPDTVAKAKAIITTWAQLDSDNIYTRDSRILSASQPGNYVTNVPLVVSGRHRMGMIPADVELIAAIDKLGPGITWLASSLTHRGYFGIAVRVALALRRLGVDWTSDLLLCVQLHKKLCDYAGLKTGNIDSYVAYLDEIDACIEEKLPEAWRTAPLPPPSQMRANPEPPMIDAE